MDCRRIRLGFVWANIRFGAAGGPMKNFYYRIAEINQEEGVIGTTRELSWGVLGTPQRMAELEGYIQQAVELATTPVEIQRVDTWKTGVWDYMKAGYDDYYN